MNDLVHALNKEVRALLNKLTADFADPAPELRLGQRYTIDAFTMHETRMGRPELIVGTLRRMFGALSIEMLRERWRVPGTPRFTISVVQEDGPQGLAGTVILEVELPTLAASIRDKLHAEQRETILRKALIAARDDAAILGKAETVEALHHRAMAHACQRWLDQADAVGKEPASA